MAALQNLTRLLLLWCIAAGSAQAASVLTFGDTWDATSASYVNYGSGYFEANVSGTANVHISLPLTNINIAKFDRDTPFSLGIGPPGAESTVYSGTLDDDKNYAAGKTSARFGNLNVSWTPASITVDFSSDTDALDEEQIMVYNSDSLPYDNTHALGGAYEATLQLGSFSYDNPNVFVTGHNTEIEYMIPFVGGVAPLQSGWIRGAADFLPPAVTVQSPATMTSSIYYPNSLVSLKGRATDNVAVASVLCIVNGDTNNITEIDQQTNLPSNSVSWTAPVDLAKSGHFGTNVLTVTALDTSGNQVSVTRTVLWISTNSAVLTVNPPGAGRISGLKFGQLIQRGFNYPLTAVASSKNWLFSGWTDGGGKPVSAEASINYTNTDGTLTANFLPNPFAHGWAGNYTGIYFGSNGVVPAESGYLSLAVTGTGTYSGNLFAAPYAKPFSVSGQFGVSSDGLVAEAVSQIKVGPSEFLKVNLELLVGGMPGSITNSWLNGSISAFSDPGETAEIWSNEIAGNTAMPDPAVEAGVYNVIIGPASASGGYSYGSATVGKSGSVSMVLHLADSALTTVSFSSYLGGDSCPIYDSLYGGQGVIIGWLPFGSGGSSAVGTQGLDWVGAGFSVGLPIFDIPYMPPKSGTNIFGWQDGIFDTEPASGKLPLIPPLGTNLIGMPVTFNPAKNTFTETKNLTINFAPKTGAISGWLAFPASNTRVVFQGVEAGGLGYGFYKSTNGQTSPISIFGK